MFDRFDLWRYSDNHNCWDFVREFLIQNTHLTGVQLPKFGVSPKDFRGITRVSKTIISDFLDTDPVQYAIACHYRGNVLLHVGVVDGEHVRHAKSKKTGALKTRIRDFERENTTVYKLHASFKRL